MLPTPLVKSRLLRITRLPVILLAIPVLPCCLSTSAISQGPGISQGLPARAPQAQSAASTALPDPRTPELQPRLARDLVVVQQQQTAQLERKAGDFKRATSACLEARGYSVR